MRRFVDGVWGRGRGGRGLGRDWASLISWDLRTRSSGENLLEEKLRLNPLAKQDGERQAAVQERRGRMATGVKSRPGGSPPRASP